MLENAIGLIEVRTTRNVPPTLPSLCHSSTCKLLFKECISKIRQQDEVVFFCTSEKLSDRNSASSPSNVSLGE